MSTIKAYTNLQQSKKLAEILPLESADMRYVPFGDTHPWVWDEEVKLLENGAIPCWSLASLLDGLPTLDNKHVVFGTSIKELKWHVFYHNFDKLFMEDSGLYDNLVDACYKLILKLNELNLL